MTRRRNVNRAALFQVLTEREERSAIAVTT